MTGSIVGNILYGVAAVLDMGLTLYIWIIFIAVIFSWIRPTSAHPGLSSVLEAIQGFVFRATEPALFWIRRRLPVVVGGLDLSPLVLLAAVYFIKFALINNLYLISVKLGAGAARWR